MGETLFGQSTPGEEDLSEFTSSYLLTKQGTEVQSKPLKVAAYVRVSTLSDEQEDSLENQTSYYARHIRSNPTYQMAGIYTDHGKSGTLTSSRSGFNRLVRHALEGKIDLILCKSVSRFARNVLDTLETVRILKENGVRLIFEKEDLDTENMQSEFILTMMAAVAQEESRSISENIKWSNVKRLERGQPKFHRLLGYGQDKNKNWIVNQEEASVVKEAFELCVEGHTPPEIARIFIRKGYKTIKGKNEWSGTAIREMLKNINYVGDVLGQKTFSKDHISHASIKNKGEKNLYLISDHHEPIVDRETFKRAQEKLKQRAKPSKEGKRNRYPLSSRIVCGKCGGNLQRFVCRGVVTWRCGKRTKSHELCTMEGIKEEYIHSAMLAALKVKYEPMELDGEPIRNTVLNMMKDINNIEIKGDADYNQLRIKLERILYEESNALLKGRDEKIEDLRIERAATELEIKEKEEWWNLVEADIPLRKNTLEKLGNVSFASESFDSLMEELNEIEYLRAWVIRVKALSPFLFSFTLVTGEEIEVEF